MALGIGAGDEVVTTPYSFFATAGSIWRTGAKPVFVDIDLETYNIDPAKIELLISAANAGRSSRSTSTARPPTWTRSSRSPGNMTCSCWKTRRKPSGPLTEGARPARSDRLRPFSFYPSKNLGGFGDGGMMTTDDPVLGRKLARLRVHGMEPKYHHHEVGINSRLDAIQAAILRVKLRHLESWTIQRREAAARYRSLFEAHGLTDLVTLPLEQSGCYHVYNQFVVRVPAPIRDPLREYLTGRQIGTEIYYPIPLHLQPCFTMLGHHPGDFPETELAARETVAMPMYPELTDEQQRYVVGSIRQFLDGHGHAHLAADRAT